MKASIFFQALGENCCRMIMIGIYRVDGGPFFQRVVCIVRVRVLCIRTELDSDFSSLSPEYRG